MEELKIDEKGLYNSSFKNYNFKIINNILYSTSPLKSKLKQITEKLIIFNITILETTSRYVAHPKLKGKKVLFSGSLGYQPFESLTMYDITDLFKEYIYNPKLFREYLNLLAIDKYKWIKDHYD